MDAVRIFFSVLLFAMLCACTQSGPVRKEIQTPSKPENQTQESPRGFLGIIHDAKVCSGDGVAIKVIMPQTTCYKMGLLPGDVIIGINQQVIHTIEDLEKAKYAIPVGMPFSLEIKRKGKNICFKEEMGRIPIGTPFLCENKSPSSTKSVHITIDE